VFVLAAILTLSLVSCSALPWAAVAGRYDATVAVAWFGLAQTLVRETPGYTPPVAARVFGYLGVTLYQTVQPGMPGYRSLARRLNEFDGTPRLGWFARIHWPTAANAALAEITRVLFPDASPAKLVAIEILEEQFAKEYVTAIDVATFRRSEAWGKAVAAAVYTWSQSDGGHDAQLHNFPDDYTPPSGLGLWERTPPGFSPALQPYWGGNRPFVVADGEECPAGDPPPYSEAPDSQFYREAQEVYDVGQTRTPEQVEIARFWADDPGRTATPSGHWIGILGHVLVEEEATLADAAEAYATVGIAVADAFITCWNTKYRYNVVRPITYIQRVIDPTWNTPEITDPVITPPFPEYTSGHSVQSGAAATVLTALFGEAYAFTDSTHEGLGLAPRAYASFWQAAEEAAISRLYGGIHFRSAIEQGLLQGRCVGEKVLDLRLRRQSAGEPSPRSTAAPNARWTTYSNTR
jgi:hypothetical protein